MTNQTIVSWVEIPVTDMDKAVAFYNRVFGYDMTIDTAGPNPMAAAAQEALVKIDTVLPDEARAQVGRVNIHAITMPWREDNWRDYLDQFEDAYEKNIRLEMTYGDQEGNETLRAVRPLTALDRFRPQKGQTIKDFYETKGYLC